MKNAYIFCFLLLTHVGLHAMKSSIETLLDWKSEQDRLASDYKTKIEERLNDWPSDKEISLDEFIEEGEHLGLYKTTIEEVLKTVRTNDGDTIAHLLVMYDNLDIELYEMDKLDAKELSCRHDDMHDKNKELVQFAKQGLISLEKNNDGLTALELVNTQIHNLREKKIQIPDNRMFTQKCFYHVLLNYAKIKQHAGHIKKMQNANDQYIWCCSLHS